MNVKTMEGLAGAGSSISMISTPMNVAEAAERKGDTDKMVRALGYAAELTKQAEEYGEKTSQGMKLDAEEAKKQEKLQQEKLIQARREERKEQEERTEPEAARNAGNPGYDSVQISEEGRGMAEAAGQAPESGPDGVRDVIYGSTGEAAEAVQAVGENLNRSV